MLIRDSALLAVRVGFPTWKFAFAGSAIPDVNFLPGIIVEPCDLEAMPRERRAVCNAHGLEQWFRLLLVAVNV